MNWMMHPIFLLTRIFKSKLSCKIFSIIFLIICIVYVIKITWFTSIELGDTPSFMPRNKNNEVLKGDNITGYSELIVPNIVHNVLFGYNELKFSHFVSLLSVLKTQKPDIIYIHCDCYRLTGPYVPLLHERLKTTNTLLKIRTIEQPKEIFGRKISKKFFNWHSSDITRLRILQEFGGIYLDNDVYVVKSLDEFRKFEFTLNRDDYDYLSNGELIAHKDARFIKLWLKSYRYYNPNGWFYNAGHLPSNEILDKRPHLAHRLRGEFGVFGPKICPLLYIFYYPKWRTDFHLIHLFMRGNEITNPNWCFPYKFKPDILYFNERVIKNLNNTFGEMCRELGIK